MTSNSDAFIATIKARRTYYALSKDAPIPDSRVKEIIESVILSVPSAYNVQSSRLIFLTGKDHEEVWQIAYDALKAIVPPEQFKGHTSERVLGFKAAYGTILFYEVPELIKKQQTDMPAYADKFPVWSEHTSAMHQFALWTALEAEGFGANLQHYHPLIDAKVAARWNINPEWSLKAQLVLGGKTGGPALDPKKQTPVEERLTYHTS